MPSFIHEMISLRDDDNAPRTMEAFSIPSRALFYISDGIMYPDNWIHLPHGPWVELLILCFWGALLYVHSARRK